MIYTSLKNNKVVYRLNTNMAITEGTIVSIARFGKIKWVVHNGWYRYEGNQYSGWYLCSIPDQVIIPFNSSDLGTMTIISNSQGCNCTPPPMPVPSDGCDCHPHPPVPPYPPYPPCPPPPAPFPPVDPNTLAVVTKDEKARYDAGFTTFDYLREVEALDKASIPDGKIIRVNHVQGEVKYYVWSKETEEWNEIPGFEQIGTVSQKVLWDTYEEG